MYIYITICINMCVRICIYMCVCVDMDILTSVHIYIGICYDLWHWNMYPHFISYEKCARR